MCDSPVTTSVFARHLVRRVARRLVARRRWRGWDADDVAQELFLRLLTAERRFDATRGGAEAFIAAVIRHAVQDLLRRERAAKRRGRVPSLHELLDFDGRAIHDPVPAVDLALDVAAVLTRLPPHLRSVAELLKTETVASATRAVDVSRSKLQSRVRALRAAFEKYKIRNLGRFSATSTAAREVNS